ncbi:hypothetical protein J4E93_006376 [Alternaria ventricosa]|uniref:uncharacterized protein n=1 Tax=Alternaria ventricosa TaxID=1187951 RepID=UPI0020C4163B|nr:uncharacterized protein J4E93_006376 [Alternaria ventricosa]KAI4644473.1 hypothetical protein J4E93_006376 [Alternaria ventricosa]
MMYPPPPPPPISIAEINAPPPPPMPTPYGPHSNLIPEASRRAALNKLDNEQQSLRDLRDKLVGSRFSVAAMRKELHNLQIERSARDGYVFNLLRQYFNENGGILPRHIEEAFNEESTQRDRLGLLEAKYDEAEARYNTLEWTYSRRETRFVEEVLNNKLVPDESVDQARSAENPEVQQLTRFMTGSNDFDLIKSDLAASGDGVEGRGRTQLSTFLAEQALMVPQKASTEFQQSRSQWSNQSDLTLVNTKIFDDLHQTHAHLRWVEKMNKIDGWLLGVVDTSPLQKLYLKSIHDFGFSDTKVWWERTKWLLIQDYSKHFHTGDSTISIPAAAQHVSKSTREEMSQELSVLEPHSTSQMLLGMEPTNVSEVAYIPNFLASSNSYETLSQTTTPRELSVATREEAKNPKYIAHSPRQISPRSIISVNDGRPHLSHRYTRSLSVAVGAGGQTELSSSNMTSISLQKRNAAHRRHTLPEIKGAEPMEPRRPTTNPEIPPVSPSDVPSPPVHPKSEELLLRRSGQSDNQLPRHSGSIRSFAAATPQSESPQGNQSSFVKRCPVM